MANTSCRESFCWLHREKGLFTSWFTRRPVFLGGWGGARTMAQVLLLFFRNVQLALQFGSFNPMFLIDAFLKKISLISRQGWPEYFEALVETMVVVVVVVVSNRRICFLVVIFEEKEEPKLRLRWHVGPTNVQPKRLCFLRGFVLTCQSTQIWFLDSCGFGFVLFFVNTVTLRLLPPSLPPSTLHPVLLPSNDAVCGCCLYTRSSAVFVLNMGDFLRLSGLFDAVQPLDDSSVSLHSRDPVRNALPALFFLVLVAIWQALVGGAPRPVTIRRNHRGGAEVQTDDIRTGSRKVLWTNGFQFLGVKATVVKKAFYISSSPGVPVWQVGFRSVQGRATGCRRSEFNLHVCIGWSAGGTSKLAGERLRCGVVTGGGRLTWTWRGQRQG